MWQNSRPVCYFSFKNWYNKLVSDLMSMLNYTGIVENAALCTVSRIGKSHMKTGFFQLWFLKKKIWSKYTLGIVVSWYNLRNCNIWLSLWHLTPQSGPFHQFWSFLLILFSKTTQKKSKHYSERAFLEVFGKCVGLGLSSSIQRPQKC